MQKLLIKPLAEKDIEDITLWYNDIRKDLGNEFLLSLEATFNSIQGNPTNFQIVYKNLRRALTIRFPYGVFYIIEENTIYVLAVVHTSRNPKSWRKRV